MPETLDSAALLQAIGEDRQALEAAVARVPAARLTEPALGGWPVKDVLAHVTYWEEDLIRRLAAWAAGAPAPEAADDFEAVNQGVWAARRDRPLDEVRRGFEATHREVRRRVAALPAAALAGPAPGQPAGSPPLWQTVAGATFEHYREHAATIEAWLAGPAGPAR